MRDFPTKVNTGSPGDNTLSAEEFNDLVTNLETSITSSGQPLTTNDPNQLSRALARYSHAGHYAIDTGTTNAYVLVTSSNFLQPVGYFPGMTLNFIATTPNTGACTVNAFGIGTVPLVDNYGQPLREGDISLNQHITIRYIASSFVLVNTELTTAELRPKLGELQLANNPVDAANVVDCTSGSVRAENGTVRMFLPTAFTKRLDTAFAVGNTNGGLFSGSKTANTTYHAFLIKRDSDGLTDIGFDTSLIAANRPAGWTYYKRMGSILTDASNNIIRFTHRGSYFKWHTPIVDAGPINTATTAVLHTLTLPTGLEVRAEVSVSHGDAGTGNTYNNYGLITSPLDNDTTPTALFKNFEAKRQNIVPWDNSQNSNYWIITDTNARIRTRFTVALTGVLSIVTMGYQDLGLI